MSSVSAPHRLLLTTSSPAERLALKERIARQPGAHILHDLPLIDGVAVEIDALPRTGAFVADLARTTPGVAVHEDADIVVPDEPAPPPRLGLVDTHQKYLGLDRVWKQGIKGKGVSVAVIDSGVAPHQDLGKRIVAFKDFVNGRTDAYDDHDHGTHCATTIAGSGWNSDYRWVGCAPEAGIVGIKVLDDKLHGKTSDLIAGIQWAVENRARYDIRVLNLSLGHAIEESSRTDPVCRAVAAAVAAGITVCVAAGNSGPGAATILAPANTPEALAVGALNDRGSADTSRHEVAKFSSRGPSTIDGEAKPDVLAPGVGIIAGDRRGDYRGMSGTSAAAPVAAGIVALLLSARPDLSPAQVKALLMRTARPLPGAPATDQGSGVIDAFQALRKSSQ